MKITKVLPLSLVVLLSACSGSSIKETTHFLFDTMVSISLKDGKKEDYKALEKILKRYDAVSDNFKARDVFNVYSWSHTNETVLVGEEEGQAPIELFNLISSSFKAKTAGADNLDYRLGSLIQKWKDAEAKGEVLSDSIIQEELAKRTASSYTVSNEPRSIKQSGVESFDYGATAKGCALDACKEYLDTREYLSDYIINAGSSSILLGTSARNKKYNEYYHVAIKELDNVGFLAKNCFVSTSGTSEQGVTIDGVRYSHIINPKDGSAVTNYDMVIVLSNNGTYGDAFSTSMMFNTIDEIKELEFNNGLRTIVIKDKEILYKHRDIPFREL